MVCRECLDQWMGTSETGPHCRELLDINQPVLAYPTTAYRLFGSGWFLLSMFVTPSVLLPRQFPFTESTNVSTTQSLCFYKDFESR